MPLCFNSTTKEPYLRLAAPHSHIIITPHRSDPIADGIPARIEILNHPAVYMCLEGPPYPHLQEHAESWCNGKRDEMQEVVESLVCEFQEPSRNGEKARIFDKCPFTCIREVTEESSDGDPLTDVFIGDIGLVRYSFYEFRSGSDERQAARDRNNAIPGGDENIVWQFGDYLAPSHHGRGIMTGVIRSVIHDWAVPRMNVRDIRASAFVGNQGSLKVFLKNNFEETCTLEDWAPVSESRGGGTRSIVVVKWRGMN
ncbi:acetyltransferase GNAT family [Penicillium angulare]|uniref:Acetyltransferase GNAT family n=1 Tax=Penicillium angulare TaxID=116970 RepID=A0A9W9ESD8_9EURO|nr:acetyltransferase GNAT family [Penicillium angulare]